MTTPRTPLGLYWQPLLDDYGRASEHMWRLADSVYFYIQDTANVTHGVDALRYSYLLSVVGLEDDRRIAARVANLGVYYNDIGINYDNVKVDGRSIPTLNRQNWFALMAWEAQVLPDYAHKWWAALLDRLPLEDPQTHAPFPTPPPREVFPLIGDPGLRPVAASFAALIKLVAKPNAELPVLPKEWYASQTPTPPASPVARRARSPQTQTQTQTAMEALTRRMSSPPNVLRRMTLSPHPELVNPFESPLDPSPSPPTRIRRPKPTVRRHSSQDGHADGTVVTPPIYPARERSGHSDPALRRARTQTQKPTPTRTQTQTQIPRPPVPPRPAPPPRQLTIHTPAPEPKAHRRLREQQRQRHSWSPGTPTPTPTPTAQQPAHQHQHQPGTESPKSETEVEIRARFARQRRDTLNHSMPSAGRFSGVETMQSIVQRGLGNDRRQSLMPVAAADEELLNQRVLEHAADDLIPVLRLPDMRDGGEELRARRQGKAKGWLGGFGKRKEGNAEEGVAAA